MPTPIGHALAGLAVAGLAGARKPLTVSELGVLLFCATAPDLDLLLKFVDGANHHRGATHSLAAAVLVGLAGYLAKGAAPNAPAWAMSAAWASHVLLDFLGVDTTPPLGEMALWPFTDAFYISPVSIFYDVSRSITIEMVRHNLIAVAFEVILLAPIVALCWRRKPARASQ